MRSNSNKVYSKNYRKTHPGNSGWNFNGNYRFRVVNAVNKLEKVARDMGVPFVSKSAEPQGQLKQHESSMKKQRKIPYTELERNYTIDPNSYDTISQKERKKLKHIQEHQMQSEQEKEREPGSEE